MGEVWAQVVSHIRATLDIPIRRRIAPFPGAGERDPVLLRRALKPSALSPLFARFRGPSLSCQVPLFHSMVERDIKFLHKDRFNPPSIQET